MEPYFDYIRKVEINPLGEQQNRPPTKDVLFRIPKNTAGECYANVRVRFHGPRDNRFMTTFPKIYTEDWKDVPRTIDTESLLLTAWVYLERTYGTESTAISNCPLNLDV